MQLFMQADVRSCMWLLRQASNRHLANKSCDKDYKSISYPHRGLNPVVHTLTGHPLHRSSRGTRELEIREQAYYAGTGTAILRGTIDRPQLYTAGSAKSTNGVLR